MLYIEILGDLDTVGMCMCACPWFRPNPSRSSPMGRPCGCGYSGNGERYRCHTALVLCVVVLGFRDPSITGFEWRVWSIGEWRVGCYSTSEGYVCGVREERFGRCGLVLGYVGPGGVRWCMLVGVPRVCGWCGGFAVCKLLFAGVQLAGLRDGFARPGCSGSCGSALGFPGMFHRVKGLYRIHRRCPHDPRIAQRLAAG